MIRSAPFRVRPVLMAAALASAGIPVLSGCAGGAVVNGPAPHVCPTRHPHTAMRILRCSFAASFAGGSFRATYVDLKSHLVYASGSYVAGADKWDGVFHRAHPRRARLRIQLPGGTVDSIGVGTRFGWHVLSRKPSGVPCVHEPRRKPPECGPGSIVPGGKGWHCTPGPLLSYLDIQSNGPTNYGVVGTPAEMYGRDFTPPVLPQPARYVFASSGDFAGYSRLHARLRLSAGPTAWRISTTSRPKTDPVQLRVFGQVSVTYLIDRSSYRLRSVRIREKVRDAPIDARVLPRGEKGLMRFRDDDIVRFSRYGRPVSIHLPRHCPIA